jgi:glycosyltransferase involved in cell wall biosynthesis
MPRVSVIVPVYNTEQYLSRCIDSIMNQNFTDFELLLVDDGSTDGSGEICDNYRKSDSRIQVIHKNNGGASSARNTGLDHSNGEYIYFADSDDYVSPNLLEKCLKAIDGYDMVAFNYQKVDENGGNIGNPTEFCVGSLRWDNEEEKANYMEETFFHYSYLGWGMGVRLFRKDIIEQNGLRFADDNNIYAEDMYFNYCYELHCNSFVCINDVLYFYTQRFGSTSSEQKKNDYLNLSRLNELSKAINEHLLSCERLSVMKKRFPLAHRNFIKHAFDRIQKNAGKMDVFCKREVIMANILDIEYFNIQAKGIINNKKELKKIFGLIESLRIIRDWHYYLTGNKFIFQLGRVIIRFCKIWEKIRRSFFVCKR